jgi:putative flavoprotein involved in K+ transport
MRSITTVVIGAGHAGLAMSRCLALRGIDHVVLERGEVANSWRTERWDSLRLLTPNWQRRLPGCAEFSDDPEGYASMPEVITFLDRYAALVAAPVHAHSPVTAVLPTDLGYLVRTRAVDWLCKSVVLASGCCNLPVVPGIAEALPADIQTLTPNQYRNPGQLDDGGVLIVGASATGVQLADEIQRSGREVSLAVGEHIRAPRHYRGRDIQWWMDAAGILDQRYNEIDDLDRARNVPSLQLVGSSDRDMLALNALRAAGVRLFGRLAGINGDKLQFSGSLANQCALSDLKMNRLLSAFDLWAEENGLGGELEPAHRFPSTEVEASPPLMLDLATNRIRTVIWATGFRPDYSWLNVPVLDQKGRIRHDGGVVEAPGLYLMGLPFMRRRKSGLIDGAGDDARELCDHLLGYLAGREARSRRRSAA